MPKSNSILIDIGQGLSLMVGMPTISIWATESRPKKPRRGTFGFNSRTENLEYFDGSHWMKARMS